MNRIKISGDFIKEGSKTIGKISGNCIKCSTGKTLSKIGRNSIKDPIGRTIGRIYGSYLKDNSGRTLSSIYDIRKTIKGVREDTTLAAI